MTEELLRRMLSAVIASVAFTSKQAKEHADLISALHDALPPPVKLCPIEGDILPPVGSDVLIQHGRDSADHLCTVTGYYVWADRAGDPSLQRVFVRLVYKGTDTENARMLQDLRRPDGTPFLKASVGGQSVQPAQPEAYIYQYRTRGSTAWHHCGPKDYANFSTALTGHYETRKLKAV